MSIPRWSAEQEGTVLTVRRRWIPPIPHCPPRLSQWRYNRVVQRDYRWLLGQWGKPDVIHAQVVLPAGFAAVKLGEQEGIPVVITEHTGPFHEAYLSTAQRRYLCDHALHGCSRVIAVSPEMKHSFARSTRSCRSRSCPISSARTSTLRYVRSRHVRMGRRAFCCRQSSPSGKGGKYLIEAARMLVQRGCTRFKVIIGGDGLSRPVWEKAVQSLGLSAYFQFRGRLSLEQVREGMRECDVFVLPSLHENFGIVSGEAMACGKPVLSTYCGGSEYVVTPETGVLVPRADSASLADAMQGFVEGKYRFDPAQMRQRRRAVRRGGISAGNLRGLRRSPAEEVTHGEAVRVMYVRNRRFNRADPSGCMTQYAAAMMPDRASRARRRRLARLAPRRSAFWAGGAGPRAVRRALDAPPLVDHRLKRGGPAAHVLARRPLPPRLQRRDLQLRRAARGVGLLGRAVPYPHGYRSPPGGVVQWGAAALPRLVGMFAFALLDVQQRTLLWRGISSASSRCTTFAPESGSPSPRR